MLLTNTRSAKILFVGGKGGVGKTSTSSALALAHAESGDRVLLVSTDPAHNLGHLWGAVLSDEATRVVTTETGWVDALEIDADATTEQHLAAVEKTMRKLLPERMHHHAQQHLALARDAPGSHEAAILERIADVVLLASESYDRVIFDTAPTGHTLRLLRLPQQLSGWMDTLIENRVRAERFGAAMRGLTSTQDAAPERSADVHLRRTLERRRERFKMLQEHLGDPESTGFVVVLTPERIPTLETIDLVASLREAGMKPVGMVINRRTPHTSDELYRKRESKETEHIRVLQEHIPDVPTVEVPLLEDEPLGVQGLQRLMQHY